MRLYNYKDSSESWIHAFIVFGAMWIIHILTLLFFIQSYFKKDFLDMIRIDYGIWDRFVLFPLLIAPIYIILFIFYKRNRAYIKSTIKDFRSESTDERKRKWIMVV